MAELKVRRLEDWVVQVWQRRARQSGRSLEDELRRMLIEEALRAQREFAVQADALRSAIAQRRGTLTDSTTQIRAEREERG